MAYHLIVRVDRNDRGVAYCGRVGVPNGGTLVERRPEPADYSDCAEGVTCKRCLRRLGLAPRVTAHGSRDAKVEQRTANAIADWLDKLSEDVPGQNWSGEMRWHAAGYAALAHDIRAGLWRKP